MQSNEKPTRPSFMHLIYLATSQQKALAGDNKAETLISQQALWGFCIFWCHPWCLGLSKLPFLHISIGCLSNTHSERETWNCSISSFRWNIWFQISGHRTVLASCCQIFTNQKAQLERIVLWMMKDNWKGIKKMTISEAFPKTASHKQVCVHRQVFSNKSFSPEVYWRSWPWKAGD